jgi:hypothetical protein
MSWIVILIVGVVLLLVVKSLCSPDCDHEMVYYDEAGDPLERVASDSACFSKCRKCSQIWLVPSGFQSDASFDNYLYQREMGSSPALKKVALDQDSTETA